MQVISFPVIRLFFISNLGVGINYLIIQIEDFQGVGSYTLGTNTNNFGEYMIGAGDIFIRYWMDQPDAGSITFDTFDLANNICSGICSFEVGFYDEMITISGDLEIPVYE